MSAESAYSNLVEEFTPYVNDVRDNWDFRSPAWDQKIRSILGNLANAAVRQALSTLPAADTDLRALSDKELADMMTIHIRARSPFVTEHKIAAGAWAMMLEAADRLAARRKGA